MQGMRLDKWLWAARWCKTRSLAVETIERGRIRVNASVAKPARELRPGDRVDIDQGGGVVREIEVLALSTTRGPAAQAQLLYRESAVSLERWQRAQLQRKMAPEPALSRSQGRPTKRDRRALQQVQSDRKAPAPWDSRWSASLD